MCLVLNPVYDGIMLLVLSGKEKRHLFENSNDAMNLAEKILSLK